MSEIEPDFKKHAFHRIGPAIFIIGSILWYVATIVYLLAMWGTGK